MGIVKRDGREGGDQGFGPPEVVAAVDAVGNSLPSPKALAPFETSQSHGEERRPDPR
jgi:hypothetical protein